MRSNSHAVSNATTARSWFSNQICRNSGKRCKPNTFLTPYSLERFIMNTIYILMKFNIPTSNNKMATPERIYRCV